MKKGVKKIESRAEIEAIGFRELREDSDRVIARVSAGESFVVKRKSKALFRIVPLEEEVWDTVIDFTDIEGAGVDADDVLVAIDELKREIPEKYARSHKKVSREA